MKKIIYLFMILLLGLSSCKKNDTYFEADTKEETFVLNGETFKVNETTKRFALILQIDEKRLSFVSDSIAYTLDSNLNRLIYIEPIIESIKNVKP